MTALSEIGEARSGSWWRRHGVPTTRWGRASAWMLLGFLGWFALNQTLLGTRDTLEGISRLPLIVYGLLGIGLGIATGIVAAVAVVRKGDRSLLAFLALVPGAMMAFFLLGEILVPH